MTLLVGLSEMIFAALVTSPLDYANSVLYGILAKFISRLQLTQNTLARIAAGNRTSCSNLATFKYTTLVANS